MKGKQLIKKLTRPSTIFAAGVFIILLIIASFVYLHTVIVNRIDEVNLRFEKINHLIFYLLVGDEEENLRIQLEDNINDLRDLEIFNMAFLIYDLNPDWDSFRINSKEDLLNTHARITQIKNNFHNHSVKREESFRILYLLIVVTIICMILFLGISQYENHKLMRSERLRNETNNKLFDQLEKERSLLAFELHDDIAQKLAIIKRYFNNKNSIDEHTVLMENYSSDVIKRVRYLSRMLKAPDNPDVTFKDYLETLFSDFNVLSDFKLNRKTVGLNALKLKPSAALHIYRVIQEILTNSRIHSEATEIDLLIVYSHPALNIKYKDNGKGFDPYLVYRKGIGLDSIKYRLDILNGQYQVHSAEGEGTDISIDIPVELCEIS